MAKQAVSRTKASTPRRQRADVIAPAAQPMMASPRAPTREAIAQRAFELYQARGEGAGDQVSDWLRAETELRSARL
jgi:hypothetical protein